MMIDHYPGRHKLLFVGIPYSSHTHSWMELMDNREINVRLFSAFGQAPAHCKYQAYDEVRPDDRMLDLAYAINEWRPDIVHTLGFEPSGFLLSHTKEAHNLYPHVWIHTSRGGPELALHRLLPERKKKLVPVLLGCDRFIADNHLNYEYARELGLAPDKIPSFGIVPGTGGVDVGYLRSLRKEKTSCSRIIVWPKAYECPASKALPVLEALKICWDKIKPCRIIMTAIIQEEIHMWFRTLSEEIQESCELFSRLPREELLERMAGARVLLSPSLTDGIPNSFYESMATGAVPIFSPLETYTHVFREGENVVYARNLYPQEIADALEKAMNDDEMVDKIAENNYALVKEMADRKKISETMYNFYVSCAPARDFFLI